MILKFSALFDDYKTSLALLVVFGFTGFVNYLRRKNFSLTTMIADIFTSLITGFVSYFVMLEHGYAEYDSLAVAFLVSHNATRLLFIADRFIEKKTSDFINKID